MSLGGRALSTGQENRDPALKPAEPVKPGLAVLANYGTVQRNGRDGHPLRIAGKMSTRGLYCHAVSRILVRLPGEGRSFTSIVGIDTNGDYSGGSVEFMVHVGDKRVFCSPVMHRGEPAVPLAVNLAGAKEFTISVGDARDNINSDQASWIDAKVTLADGREIWLGDLPLVQGAVPWRQAVVPPFSFVYDDLPSDDLLGNWKFKECVEQLPLRKTRQTQTYTDPKPGLKSAASSLSTGTTRRSNGRCTSETRGPEIRLSWKTSRHWTRSSIGTQANSACTTLSAASVPHE